MEAPVVETFLERIRSKSNQQAAKALDMPEENIPLLFISGILINRIAKMMGANMIWAPGVTLCDGMAYEYAENIRSSKRSMISSRISLPARRI